MGSGKTAVGSRLAALLGKEFFDSDAEIEKRTGVDIRFIFEKEGEARFREREREVIADLTALRRRDRRDWRRRGARCRRPARGSRHRHGDLSAGERRYAAQRTKPSRNRPLLMNDDPRAVLERLMAVASPALRGDRRPPRRHHRPAGARRGRERAELLDARA